jgi:hypothetical protein
LKRGGSPNSEHLLCIRFNQGKESIIRLLVAAESIVHNLNTKENPPIYQGNFMMMEVLVVHAKATK